MDCGESLCCTAEKFGVLRSTLHDHIVGKVKLGAVSGPSPYLMRDEEEELVNLLVCCSEIGYAYSQPQVLALVQQVVDAKGIENTMTYGWWQRFCQQHTVSLLTAVPLSLNRAKATEPFVIER